MRAICWLLRLRKEKSEPTARYQRKRKDWSSEQGALEDVLNILFFFFICKFSFKKTIKKREKEWGHLHFSWNSSLFLFFWIQDQPGRISAFKRRKEKEEPRRSLAASIKKKEKEHVVGLWLPCFLLDRPFFFIFFFMAARLIFFSYHRP